MAGAGTTELKFSPSARPREFLSPGEPELAAVRKHLWQSHDASEWFIMSAEKWAEREAVARWGRGLFWMDCHLGADRHQWEKFTDQWWGKSVAVLSDGSYDPRPSVGICFGVRPGMLGAAVCIARFGTHGSTLHVSPLGMWDIFELCEDFQEPPGRYEDERDYEE